MIKKIAFDMDGVLADFVTYFEKESEKPMSYWNDPVNKSEFKAMKTKLVSDGMFAYLPLMEEAKNMVYFAKSTGLEVFVLTAVGEYATDVAVSDKELWLKMNGIDLPFKYVVKSSGKDVYADPETVLIDDRDKSLEPFKAAGGKTIKHINSKRTIYELKGLLSG